MEQTEKSPMPPKKKKMLILCIVLAVILAILIAVLIYVGSLLGLINHPDPNQEYVTPEEYEQEQTNDPTYTGPTEDPNAIVWTDANTIGAGQNIVNLLLIGQDRRPGESRARSDSMILCTVNKEKKTVTLSSFMRDMYVQIPGYSDNRINASYAFGGMELLNSCIKKNFGVAIDGNIEVDFYGFAEVIDNMGGLNVELTSAEAAYLNRRGNWDIENNAGQWSLVAGMNQLTGSQTVAYSRIREVGNGDFGRTERQRKVLNIIAEKARNMSWAEIDSLMRSFLPLLTTDMTNDQILGFAMELFPMLTDIQINSQQIPAADAYRMTMINDMSVLLPDMDKNRQILSDIMQ